MRDNVADLAWVVEVSYLALKVDLALGGDATEVKVKMSMRKEDMMSSQKNLVE